MSVWSQFWFPDPKTENAKNLILYHDLTLVVSTMVLVVVVWFLVIFLFHSTFFGGMMNRHVSKNDKLEVFWAVVPAFFLAGLGYVSLVNLYNMELGDGAEHVMKVKGHQWYWEYEYPVSFLNQFVNEEKSYRNWFAFYMDEARLPKPAPFDEDRFVVWNGRKVNPLVGDIDYQEMDWFVEDLSVVNYDKFEQKFWNVVDESYMTPGTNMMDVNFSAHESGFRNADVSSPALLVRSVLNEVLVSTADVMHSWGVCELGVKADAIPGRINSLGIIPYSSGVAYGFCYELCGVGHSNMPIQVAIGDKGSVSTHLMELAMKTSEMGDYFDEYLSKIGEVRS